MWAAKAQTAAPKAPAGDLARIITKEISACERLPDLEDVMSSSSSSFDYIHTAASLVKYARLSKRAGNQALLKRLVSLWLQVLPDADTRTCSNTLWAIGTFGLSDQLVWDRTWEENIRHIQRDLLAADDVPIPAQKISSVLLACGKLSKQPPPDQLQLLLEAFLHTAVLEASDAQGLSNVLLALSRLCQLKDWQAQVSEQQLQLLLGDTQLAALDANGSPQAVSNVPACTGPPGHWAAAFAEP